MDALTSLSQANEQHRANLYEWFAQSNGKWLEVSTFILKMPNDGIEGIVSKLATLKLGELQEEYHRRFEEEVSDE